jgi:hypothetical protein
MVSFFVSNREKFQAVRTLAILESEFRPLGNGFLNQHHNQLCHIGAIQERGLNGIEQECRSKSIGPRAARATAYGPLAF